MKLSFGVVVCSLAPLVSGCSLVFVSPPPDEALRTQRLDCTTSKAAPVVDTLVTGFEVIRTGVALGADDSDYNNLPISRGADIGFGVGLTALFAASTIYGFVNTGQCSRMKDERFAEEIREAKQRERQDDWRQARRKAAPPARPETATAPPVRDAQQETAPPAEPKAPSAPEQEEPLTEPPDDAESSAPAGSAAFPPVQQ